VNASYAIVILIYGICLTAGTAFWMRRLGEPWRRVRRTLYVFVAFVLLLSPVLGFAHGFTGFDIGWPILWTAPLEEGLKLALVLRLGADGRRAVAICLLFGSFEVIVSKALLAMLTPASEPLWFLFAGVTLAVIMHGATGFIYAESPKVRRSVLFGTATLVHLLNNASVFYIMSHTTTITRASAMELCVTTVIVACTVLFREATRHLPIRQVVAPVREAEPLAVDKPFV
jgi:hypothetical protein